MRLEKGKWKECCCWQRAMYGSPSKTKRTVAVTWETHIDLGEFFEKKESTSLTCYPTCGFVLRWTWDQNRCRVWPRS